ncbi:MAG: thermonuclease family protein [Gammaproteobacteria bacterium]|nr:thermonuclease family protein [Gammaproteobacteria bacterium]
MTRVYFLFPLLMNLIAWTGGASADDIRYRLAGVEDGDTLKVTLDGQSERLQLMGIDAPENTSNPKLAKDIQRTGLSAEALLVIGNAAADHLRSLTESSQIIRVEKNRFRRDKYGRLSVIAHNDTGRSLNLSMVEDGYAVVLGRYPVPDALKSELLQAQEEAIRESRGLWGRYPEITRTWSGRVGN